MGTRVFLVAVALGASLLAACSSPTADTPDALPRNSLGTVNRIVYIGTDNNVHTISEDGMDHQQLTRLDFGPVVRRATSGLPQVRTSYYAWPTWSPDGRKLAVSRVVSEGTPVDGIELRVIDRVTGEERVVFTNSGETPAMVARDAPHYTYWHPDGERLGFLAAEPDGLTLFVGPVDAPEDVDDVLRGAPLYFTWAPNGRSALLHVGEELLLSESGDGRGRKALAPRNVTYRAAAWSHDSQRMAYIDDSPQGGQALYAADAKGQDPAALAAVGSNTSFLWSPTNDLIAFADTKDRATPYHTALRALDPSTSEVKVMVNEPVLAFFWSPDGSRIAYVSIDVAEQRLAWKVVATDGTPPRLLTEFIPSTDLFTMLSFFDQYANSHSLWSPDGTKLVFAGQAPGADGGTATGDLVYVVPVDGEGGPEAVVEGSLAFWSWN